MRKQSVRFNLRVTPEVADKVQRIREQHAFYGVRSVSDVLLKGIMDLYDKFNKTELEKLAAKESALANGGYGRSSNGDQGSAEANPLKGKRLGNKKAAKRPTVSKKKRTGTIVTKQGKRNSKKAALKGGAN